MLVSSPLLLAASLIVVAAITLTVYFRPIQLPRLSMAMILPGLILLALAAGGLTWLSPSPREVAVMVDLSPSTRTAAYRDAATLHRRISELLGPTPYRIVYFAADSRTAPITQDKLPDFPADRTLFTPPPAAAIVLFSDVQFDLPPAAPPIYIAVDPMLQDPPDGAITNLEIRGGELAATVANESTDARELTFTSAQAPSSQMVGRGSFVLTAPFSTSTTLATARLSGADPWPENNQLSIGNPPPALSARWWVGGAAAGAGWTHLSPRELPADPAEYLAPAIIVLDNVAADELSSAQQQRLQQYVRDLGGSLMILGGNRAFAAGGYQGTLLESLSPLASTPPSPTLHWIILMDGSGSMAATDRGVSRWAQIRQAATSLLPRLPPEDPVSIGSFAEKLTWWSAGKSARETAAMSLPPAGISPTGPTNLEPALLQIISSADGTTPRQLLLMTDADTQIDQPDVIGAGLMEKKIRLDLLTIGNGRGLPILSDLARSSGGRVLTELDPSRWTQAAEQLFQAAAPDRLSATPATVRFLNDLAALPPRIVAPWNHTSLKKSATAVAETAATDGETVLAARWNVGTGQVLAIGFSPSPAEASATANLIAQPPRDPRFKIAWHSGPRLVVSVDAATVDGYLNGESPELELRPESPAPSSAPTRLFIPQTAPGYYEISIPAPRQPTIATVRQNRRALDRTAIAARYAPEFDAIGNNLPAMQELANRTGGQIIAPTRTQPIEFGFPTRQVPLASWLASIGAACLAAGLLRWRMG